MKPINWKIVNRVINTPVHGDCQDFMRKLPAGFISTVITSIPYYGKRFYPGFPARIYGGADDCEHQWIDGFECPTKMGTVGSTETKKHKKLVSEGKPPTTSFCSDCGAWKGWIGLEPHPSLMALDICRVGRDIRRVTHGMGSWWLNVGDGYAGSGKGAWDVTGPQKERYVPKPGVDPITLMPKTPDGYKLKDLYMFPSHLAIALQQPWITCNYCTIEGHSTLEFLTGYDRFWRKTFGCKCGKTGHIGGKKAAFSIIEPGWYLRAEIVWAKPAPMPEGVQDRPHRAHEMIYLLTPSKQYYYDNDAVREPYAEASLSRYQYEYSADAKHAQASANPIVSAGGYIDANPQGRNKRTVWTVDAPGECPHCEGQIFIDWADGTQTVWTIGTAKGRTEHSAAYPTDLIEPCVLAGASPKICGVCATPWKRLIQKGDEDTEWQKRSGADAYGGYDGDTEKDTMGGQSASDAKASILNSMVERETVGWQAQCECNAEPRPGIVYDPFGGTGTTAVAAFKHGRDFIINDASRKYCDIMSERLHYMVDQESVDDLRW